ncbi:MAG: DUF2071 domain-containing protein [Thermoleophilia bacterium]|nr:DUF2071 domain-containing protein [Thermoleophilia bacterium]
MAVAEYLTTPARQRATLAETEHRPWPLPRRDGWLMAQTWENLLFAHWPASPDALRTHVPSELPVDTWEGEAWLGITPFRVRGVRLRATPPPPLASSFLELNARTYVTLEEKPGIWFFSLDASSRLAVEAARRLYRLPYFHAGMSADVDGGGRVRYTSARRTSRERRAEFRAAYRPSGDASPAALGSLEAFLAERYCLYTVHRGRVLRGEIHHPPWPLRAAEAELERNSMAPPGIPTDGEPLLHLADRQDVLIWPLEPVDGA